MFHFFQSRKGRLAFGLGVCLILAAVSAVAIAFWTGAGEGTGTVKVNHTSPSLEVSGSQAENLYPGGSAAITVKVKNTDAGANGYLGRLEAEVTGTSAAECKSQWFEVTPASQEPATVLAPGETKEYSVSLKMKEEASVNQNACKGATVTIHYTAS
ncbi:MAG TPA: hypothetical protein VMF09_05950 [Solirubrobacteraceae bacterium]|nr:hypothetical protein [Solirubrobacteraceae bacterium]